MTSFRTRVARPRVRLAAAAAAAAALTVCQAGTAAAEEWYAGGGLAVQHLNFEPHYTFVNGDAPQQFDDPATGPQVNVTIGQRFGAGRRVFLGWQGTASLNDVAWSLSIPGEPADLEYSLPFTFVVSAVPEVRLAPRVIAFGSAGVGAGRVREVKTSPSSSTYDHRAFEPLVAWGAGVRLRALARADVFVRYDDLKTSTFAYDTFAPSGARVEHVEDAPRSRGLSFGVLVGF